LLVAGVRLWQQHQEIETLKVQAQTAATDTSRNTTERAQLEKNLRVARDEVTALRKELTDAREQANDAAANTAALAKAAKNSAGGATDPSAVNDATLKQWLADADDPAVLRRLNLQARNKTMQRYGELFNQLKLTPEQTEQLTKLLTDKRQANMDVAVTSYQHGEDPTQDMDAYRDRVVAAREGIENQIAALLGDSAYAQYQDYDRSVGQMNVLNNLQLALRATSEPLTAEQADRFKGVLQDNNSTRITAKVIRDAREVLSPIQMQALEDLRAVQQANSQKRNQPMQALPNSPTVPAKPKQ
jgi:hypothetical protein